MGINLHNNYSVFSVQLFPRAHMCMTTTMNGGIFMALFDFQLEEFVWEQRVLVERIQGWMAPELEIRLIRERARGKILELEPSKRKVLL